MIGFIPSGAKTYEVYGSFVSEELVEGKLYYQPETKRLYYYSLIENRSNPNTGYFPVWDGKKTYTSNFSNRKYFDKDVTPSSIEQLCSSINKDVAENVAYKHRISVNDTILKPPIKDGDNMFTQCVKGVICAMNITMVDLIDMCKPNIEQRVIENYYSALTKISFMRLEKWYIWLNIVLHVTYTVDVYKGKKRLVSYNYHEDKFDTGIVKYDNIIKSSDDAFKKLVKILMVMENINKTSLKSEDVDDYTINNMFTTLNSKKPLSAQLFSRFIRMTGLSYSVKIYEKDKLMFEYRE